MIQRTFHSLVIASVLLVTATLPLGAQAQEGFTLNRYRPAPTIEDGFMLQLPDTLGHLRWSVQLSLDYAHDPLTLRVRSSNDEIGDIVEHALGAHLTAALGLFDWLDLFVGLPLVLYQSGEAPAAVGVANFDPSTAGVGQPYLGASVHLYGERDTTSLQPQGLQVGLSASLGLPVGTTDALASDDGVTFLALASLAYATEWVIPVLNLGVQYRPNRDFLDIDVGTEMQFGIGAHLPLFEHALRLVAELNGASSFRSGEFFTAQSTPLELLLGGRYTTAFGLSAGAGVSAGLVRAVGDPVVRFIANVGYAPPRPRPVTRIKKTRAKTIAPPRDRDGDGINDKDDACPDTPEDMDGFQDDDGCPEIDNDQDGILDSEDNCPDEPENHNGYQDGDGCPDTAPQIVIEDAALTMPEPIEFQLDKAELLPESIPTLEMVAKVMREHPEIKALSIEGHTSDEGTPDYNLDLSRRRARTVALWLWKEGEVEAKRLRIRGYGETRPLLPNDSDEHRHLNRRVEFIILERVPPAQEDERIDEKKESNP